MAFTGFCEETSLILVWFCPIFKNNNFSNFALIRRFYFAQCSFLRSWLRTRQAKKQNRNKKCCIQFPRIDLSPFYIFIMPQTKEEQVKKLYQILLQRNYLNIQAVRQFVKKASASSNKKKQDPLFQYLHPSEISKTPHKSYRSKYSSIDHNDTKESETKISSPATQRAKDELQERQERKSIIKLHKYSLPKQIKCTERTSPNKSTIMESELEYSTLGHNTQQKERIVRPAHRTWKTESQKAILNFRQIVFPAGDKNLIGSRASDYTPFKKTLENKKEGSGNQNLVKLCDEILMLKKLRDTKSFLPNIKKANELKHQLSYMFLKDKQTIEGSPTSSGLLLEAVPIHNIDWDLK